MAFGLDVVDLIYADENLVDLGTLEDYEVDLDLASSKDFELTLDEFLLEIGDYWYVEGTEIGGRVYGFTTDPTSDKIKYTGLSWRGILNSKVVYSTQIQNEITLSGKFASSVNQMLDDFGLSSLFTVDTEYDEEVNINIVSGKTVYEALMEIADDLDLGYSFIYEPKDKKVHIVCNTPYDYSDYLTYCKDNSISFEVKVDTNITNHMVVAGVDENGTRRVIHLFTDEDGELQPYLKDGVTSAKSDDDYILDESKRVLSGMNEVVSYETTDITVKHNYELLTKKPSDWNANFSNYYEKVLTPSYEDPIQKTIYAENNVVEFDSYLFEGGFIIKRGDSELKRAYYDFYQGETVTLLEFDTSFAYLQATVDGTIYVIDGDGSVVAKYSGSLNDLVVKVDGETLTADVDYSASQVRRSKKLKFNKKFHGQIISVYVLKESQVSYNNISEIQNDYTLTRSKPAGWEQEYSYYYTRDWDEASQQWNYNAVSSTTRTDYSKLTRIKSKHAPTAWRVDYGDYVYYFNTGTKKELRNYAGISKNKYVRMTSKPSDWSTNFGSYYKKKGRKYVSVSGVKRGKKTVAPTFRRRKYFRQDSYERVPAYKRHNCYLPATKVVAPTWKSYTYYKVDETRSRAPKFVSNYYYKRLDDHYDSLVEAGISQYESLRSSDSQEVSVDNLNLNIGDTVGGEDSMTGLTITNTVTNIVIKIQNGVMTVDYSVG